MVHDAVMTGLVRRLAWVGLVGCAASPARTPASSEPVSAVMPVSVPTKVEAGSGEVVEAGGAEPTEPSEPPEPMAAEVADAEPSSDGLPRVRVAPVTVGPKWPPELIKRIVGEKKLEMRRCHAADPGAPAATLGFTIGTGGVVTGAEARVAGVASSHPAHTCVLAELRSLRFPPDMAGITILYPVR